MNSFLWNFAFLPGPLDIVIHLFIRDQSSSISTQPRQSRTTDFVFLKPASSPADAWPWPCS